MLQTLVISLDSVQMDELLYLLLRSLYNVSEYWEGSRDDAIYLASIIDTYVIRSDM